MIAGQNLVIFGKLFEKGETITNNINGKIYTKEQIINKLKEKGYVFIDNTEKTEKIEKIEKTEPEKKEKNNRSK